MSHGKLQKKNIGSFSENELAFLGTSCERMEDIARALIHASKFSWTYVDGDHQKRESFKENKMVIADGDVLITHAGILSDFEKNKWLSHSDGVLVNGHHFPAKKQVIIYDEKKRESVEKRRAQLTEIVAFYCDEFNPAVDAYFTSLFPNQYAPEKVVEGIEKLSSWLDFSFMKMPELQAVVLAGGKSVRMGEDKTEIAYHGIPQTEYVVKMCEELGMKTFVSCRPDQQDKYVQKGYHVISDRIEGIGPMGGMISAFMNDSSKAYLVVASDMPLLDAKAIEHIMDSRNAAKLATSFFNEQKQWPEPLFTIWEPKSYAQMLYFISLGISCPRKVLMNSDIQIISTENLDVLMNVNHPEELLQIKKILKNDH